MRQPAGKPKCNPRPTSTNSVRSNPLASIPDHPNPTLMTVALTVTFQGQELLPAISVPYVVIPGLPSPPSFIRFINHLRLLSSGDCSSLVAVEPKWSRSSIEDTASIKFSGARCAYISVILMMNLTVSLRYRCLSTLMMWTTRSRKSDGCSNPAGSFAIVLSVA